MYASSALFQDQIRCDFDLEKLARKIGQGDLLAYRFEEAANDNPIPKPHFLALMAVLIGAAFVAFFH